MKGGFQISFYAAIRFYFTLSLVRTELCKNADFEEAMMQGVRQSRLGEFSKAISCLERARTFRKDDETALLYLGEAYLKTERLDISIKVCTLRSVAVSSSALTAFPDSRKITKNTTKEDWRMAVVGLSKITNRRSRRRSASI